MRGVTGLVVVLGVWCAVFLQGNAQEPDMPEGLAQEAEDTLVDPEVLDAEQDAASVLVWQELATEGRSATKVVSIGGGRVAGEQMLLFSAGVDSADGLKYTALWHYAVSPDGKIYSMDPSRSTEWRLIRKPDIELAEVPYATPADLAVHNGMYTRTDSTEKSNGILLLKSVTEELLLFELRLFEKGEELTISGIIPVTESGRTRYDAPAGNAGEFLLGFFIDRESQEVSITHKGALDVFPDGLYRYINADLRVQPDTAVALIKSLSPALTSLNVYNSQGILKCAGTEQNPGIGSDRYIITAENSASGKVFAKFAVASDLSSVYRTDDDMDEPVLIFGTGK